MVALCVDDEYLTLKALKRAVEKSPDISEAVCFDDGQEALEWAKSHHVDVAFLDIELHEMNGIELAQSLLAMYPDCSVIFCTGYEQYALKAIKLHMDVGYLVKPFRQQQIQEEIDHVKSKKTADKPLKAVCFGNFNVYVNNKPLEFKRNKTKELLAYLIDRRGAGSSANELCAVLWEDETDDTKNRDYLYHLIADLKKTLRQAGVENVLLTIKRGYAVDVDLIDCDYYRFLEGEKQAGSLFMGEYMHQYSWGEVTCAWLTGKIHHAGGRKV